VFFGPFWDGSESPALSDTTPNLSQIEPTQHHSESPTATFADDLCVNVGDHVKGSMMFKCSGCPNFDCINLTPKKLANQLASVEELELVQWLCSHRWFSTTRLSSMGRLYFSLT
jgi:hypothetical protein